MSDHFKPIWSKRVSEKHKGTYIAVDRYKTKFDPHMPLNHAFWTCLLSIFLACHIQLRQKETHTSYPLTDIQNSYYYPIIDTILNHSNLPFTLHSQSNIDFFFPPDTFFIHKKPELIKDALASKAHCLQLLGNKPYTQKMRIIYFKDREHLRPFLQMTPKGIALPDAHTLLIATNDSIRAYHKHEMMHILSIVQFGGYAAQPTDWIQEGIAVYADNPCQNYPIHMIAAYLLHTKQHVSLDSLIIQFRAQPEMKAYMQAGSVTEFILERYGMDSFISLWQQGAGEFSSIFNKTIEELETDYHEFLRSIYSQRPDVEWDRVNEFGCG